MLRPLARPSSWSTRGRPGCRRRGSGTRSSRPSRRPSGAGPDGARSIEAGSLAATRDALASATEAPLVVVVGGDGTVREAAAALADRADAAGDRAGRDRQRPRLDARDPRDRPRDRRHPGRPATPPGPRDGPLVADLARSDHAAGWPRADLHGRLRDGPRCPDHGRRRARVEAPPEVRRVRRRRGPGARPPRIVPVPDRGRRRPIEIEGYLVLVANAGELVPGRVGPRQPIDPVERPPRAHRRSAAAIPSPPCAGQRS